MTKVTAIAVAKKVAVATMLRRGEHRSPGEAVARGASAGDLRAVADEHAGDDEHGSDDDLGAAVEGVGQPAVAVEVGPAGDQREPRATRDQADEEPAAPVEREAAAPDVLDDVGERAGDAEAAVEQQTDRDHAEPEGRAADVPRKLMMEHAPRLSIRDPSLRPT